MEGFLPEGDERHARRRMVVHRLTIGGSLLAVAVAAVFILQTTSGSASAKGDAAGSVFGLGRNVVHTTPGSELQGSLKVPEGIDSQDVHWSVVANAGRGTKLADGDGARFSFTAPERGEVTLQASVRAGERAVSQSTIFVIRTAAEYAGTDVSTRGSVEIDGGPAIEGEALENGAMIDASRGDITYVARARKNGSLVGEVTFSGTRFTVEATDGDDGRVLNTASVRRETTGDTRTLDADVQHLDDVGYVQVQTPDAVAMVKGTTFRARVFALGSTFSVRTGRLMVVDRFRLYSRPQMVEDGEQATIDALEEQAVEYGTGDDQSGTGTDGSEGPGADDLLGALAGDLPPEVVEQLDVGGDPLEDKQVDEQLDDLVQTDSFEQVASEVGGDRLDGTTDTTKPPALPKKEPTTTDTTTTDTTNQQIDPTRDTVTPPADKTLTCTNGYILDGGVCKPPPPPKDRPYRLPWFDMQRCDTLHVQWNTYSIPPLCVPPAMVPVTTTANRLFMYPTLKWDAKEWGCHDLDFPMKVGGLVMFNGSPTGSTPAQAMDGHWCSRMLKTGFDAHVNSTVSMYHYRAFTLEGSTASTRPRACYLNSEYLVPNTANDDMYCQPVMTPRFA